jgi:putative transcriptional regulator
MKAVRGVSPHHHPSDATLLAYASGQLAEGLALVVATHLAWCAACREAVGVLEAAGGALLAQAEPSGCAEDLLDRTLAALDQRSVTPVLRPAAPATQHVLPDLELPEPLRSYVGRLERPSWRRLGPGVAQITLLRNTAAGGCVRLLRIRPGRKMPSHGHTGVELAVVLAGAYRDEIGRFARGDLADLDAAIAHQPAADEREGCVCLLATQGPLRFEGRFLRLVQPLLGL